MNFNVVTIDYVYFLYLLFDKKEHRFWKRLIRKAFISKKDVTPKRVLHLFIFIIFENCPHSFPACYGKRHTGNYRHYAEGLKSHFRAEYRTSMDFFHPFMYRLRISRLNGMTKAVFIKSNAAEPESGNHGVQIGENIFLLVCKRPFPMIPT